MTKRIQAVLITALFLAAAGCTNYYKVTDPTTGKVYYTTRILPKENGAAKLEDARTGNTINLQNTEVQKITKEQFKSGKNTPPSTMPVN